MAKRIRILLVEDDFYARHWMEMMLRRDWRTQVVGEVESPTALAGVLQDLNHRHQRIDLALIDTDIPHDRNWLSEALNLMSKHNPKTAILFTGVSPNYKIAQLISNKNFGGYILKNEIRYSLAWAITLAAEGRRVITPGVCNLFQREQSLPSDVLIVDGRNPVANFSQRDAEAARLAFMFSMERRDLASALEISEEYSYGMVSALYEKMGLNDVLNGDANPELYFGSHPAVNANLERTFAELKEMEKKEVRTKKGRAKKIKDKETLAFHLLTLPEIETA
jgi:DNA-binding NarL/FixJ family response regulator